MTPILKSTHFKKNKINNSHYVPKLCLYRQNTTIQDSHPISRFLTYHIRKSLYFMFHGNIFTGPGVQTQASLAGWPECIILSITSSSILAYFVMGNLKSCTCLIHQSSMMVSQKHTLYTLSTLLSYKICSKQTVHKALFKGRIKKNVWFKVFGYTHIHALTYRLLPIYQKW